MMSDVAILVGGEVSIVRVVTKMMMAVMSIVRVMSMMIMMVNW